MMDVATLAGHRVDDIILLNTRIEEFWQDGACGWAPRDASELLREAALGWQAQLSRTLEQWLVPGTDADSDARLILSWVNLGTLVEGTLKWFLCVYRDDYANSPMRNRFGAKRGQLLEPPDSQFNELITYFENNIWTTPGARESQSEWHRWTRMVQRRRNAIHAFQARDIGTHNQFLEAVCRYRDFLLDLNAAVPYPDEPPGAPIELACGAYWNDRDEKREIECVPESHLLR